MVKRTVAFICLLAVLSGIAGCAVTEQPASSPQGVVNFTFFDTVSYIYSYAGDTAEEFNARSAAVSDILMEYHKLFDIYHEYSGINNLCTVNRLAGQDPVEVDSKLIDFLLYAEELYKSTDGEMNITMGAVLKLWHDCRTIAADTPAQASIPAESELLDAAKHIDFSLLEIDKENSTVRLTDPLASIDVGALGKGYATEMAAQYLEAQGISGYVLNIGGNIRLVGTKADGSGFKTGIKDPQDPDNSFAAIVLLQDTSCVTSGNYERFYTVGGKRYHHIIDPDTMQPAEHFSSVTVITKDSGLADALSTALFCMSYEDGVKLLESFENVDVLWITEDGTQHYTAGFENLIVE